MHADQLGFVEKLTRGRGSILPWHLARKGGSRSPRRSRAPDAAHGIKSRLRVRRPWAERKQKAT